MGEGEGHQSGSWLGDLTHEWKTAKPPEKAFIVIAVLAVAGIAYYVYTKNQGAATSTTNAPGASTAGTTGATTDNGTGGIPTIPQGSTPILPSGYSPIYDASGNVVGYQQGGQALTGTQPAPSTSTTPTANTTPPMPSLTPAQAQQTGQLLPLPSGNQGTVGLPALPPGGSFTNLGNGLYQVVGGTNYSVGTLLKITPPTTPKTQTMKTAQKQATKNKPAVFAQTKV